MAGIFGVQLISILASLLIVYAVPTLIIDDESLRAGVKAFRKIVIDESLVTGEAHTGVAVLAPGAVRWAADTAGDFVHDFRRGVGLALDEAVGVIRHEEVWCTLRAVTRPVVATRCTFGLARGTYALDFLHGHIDGTGSSGEASVVQSV